jgi:hypothetical protein
MNRSLFAGARIKKARFPAYMYFRKKPTFKIAENCTRSIKESFQKSGTCVQANNDAH